MSEPVIEDGRLLLAGMEPGVEADMLAALIQFAEDRVEVNGALVAMNMRLLRAVRDTLFAEVPEDSSLSTDQALWRDVAQRRYLARDYDGAVRAGRAAACVGWAVPRWSRTWYQ